MPNYPAELTPEQQLIQEIHDMEELLLADSPLYPQALAKIHHEIKNNPQLISCLGDEEIGKILSGLKKYTNTEISATKKKKKKATPRVSGKTVTALDLL